MIQTALIATPPSERDLTRPFLVQVCRYVMRFVLYVGVVVVRNPSRRNESGTCFAIHSTFMTDYSTKSHINITEMSTLQEDQ